MHLGIPVQTPGEWGRLMGTAQVAPDTLHRGAWTGHGPHGKMLVSHKVLKDQLRGQQLSL